MLVSIPSESISSPRIWFNSSPLKKQFILPPRKRLQTVLTIVEVGKVKNKKINYKIKKIKREGGMQLYIQQNKLYHGYS